jgi:hypothetical protein
MVCACGKDGAELARLNADILALRDALSASADAAAAD